MLRVAFKEWAAVCGALADGRQALIIRKGGIAEVGGVFKPEYDRFWLYPTFLHQQHGGVKPAAEPYLAAATANRPPDGVLRFSHFAEVAGVYFVRSLDAALSLNDLHVWSADTIRQRFHYRSPGLYVLPVRIFRGPSHEVPEHPAYAGCKTWVELDRALSTEGSTPLLPEAAFAETAKTIHDRLAESIP